MSYVFLWMFSSYFQIAQLCTAVEDESTPTDDGRPGGDRQAGHRSNSKPDPDFNSYGTEAGMTLVVLKTGELRGFATNAEGSKYYCNKKTPPVVKWSKYGSIGDAIFWSKLVVCGVSMTQVEDSDDLGCVKLEENFKKEFEWVPLKSALPDSFKKVGIKLSFVFTSAGIFGAINRGNTDNSTYLLESLDAKKWEEGPALPDKISNYCLIMMGTRHYTTLIGGIVGGESQKGIHVYNWKKKIWQSGLESMPEGRHDMACGIRRAGSTQIVVLGGLDSANKPLRKTIAFDCSKWTWTELPKFHYGGPRDLGIVGAIFTIYFGEPMALGGKLKDVVTGQDSINLDGYHLQKNGQNDDSSFWTTLERTHFPSLEGLDPLNPIRFDVSPRNIPFCEEIKDSRRSRRCYQPNVCGRNCWCGACDCNRCRPRTYCGCGTCYKEKCCYNYYGGCNNDYNCGQTQVSYCDYVPHVDTYVHIQKENDANSNGGGNGEQKYGDHEKIEGAQVHCSNCKETHQDKTTGRNGSVYWKMCKLVETQFTASKDDYSTKTINVQIDHTRKSQDFYIYLTKTIPECHPLHDCRNPSRRSGGSKTFSSFLSLSWTQMPKDLDLHLIEYEDAEFNKLSCRISASDVKYKPEARLGCKSKVVIPSVHSNSYGRHSEKIGLMKKKKFFYAIEVHDNTPQGFYDANKDPGKFYLKESQAQVHLYETMDKKFFRDIKISSMVNKHNNSEDFSHWFVGCFGGGRRLSAPKNFVFVNMGYKREVKKGGTTRFLEQKIHREYCGKKMPP